MSITHSDIQNTLKKINAFNEVSSGSITDGMFIDEGHAYKIKIADTSSFLKQANNDQKTSVSLLTTFESLINRVLTKNNLPFILESDVHSRTEVSSYLIVPSDSSQTALPLVNQAINTIRTYDNVFKAAISAPQAQELIKQGNFHIGLTPGGNSFDITKEVKNPAPKLTQGKIAEPTFGGKEVKSPWETTFNGR